MKIRSEFHGPHSQTIKFFGSLVGLSCVELLKVLHKIQDKPVKRVVVDMRHICSASNAGLKILLMGMEALDKKGIEVILLGLKNSVKRTFRTYGFDRFFMILTGSEHAIITANELPESIQEAYSSYYWKYAEGS